jgi:hypothetical protein
MYDNTTQHTISRDPALTLSKNALESLAMRGSINMPSSYLHRTSATTGDTPVCTDSCAAIVSKLASCSLSIVARDRC